MLPEVSNIGTGMVMDEDEEDDDDTKDMSAFLAAGLFHPKEEESRWHGVHMLGLGENARVGLWIRANEQNIIEEVSCAKL